MLTPLNLADVNTLLHHLPQRTHVPQSVDDRNDALDYEVDLGFGREAANAKS